jgi:tetratricopeptide (TPR) repeat protein
VPENPRIEELKRRVQKDPASIAFAQLAEEYRRAGEHEEAVRVCRAGLAKHPSYLSARVTLGRALIELQQYDEAHTELEYVLRSAPENLAAIRGLAEIYQRRGELAEALKQYEAALAIAQHDPELEEAVQELTRQLGGVPEPSTPTPPIAPPPRRIAPPPIPPVALPSGTSQEKAVASPVAAPELVVETLTPVAGSAAPPLSAELEAAADEFTRALEALDSLNIELPTPPLGSESFELSPIRLSDDEQAIPAQEWEQAGLDAALAQRENEPAVPAVTPGPTASATSATPATAAAAQSAAAAHPDPDAAAIADLQDWLDNIVLDRTKP